MLCIWIRIHNRVGRKLGSITLNIRPLTMVESTFPSFRRTLSSLPSRLPSSPHTYTCIGFSFLQSFKWRLWRSKFPSSAPSEFNYSLFIAQCSLSSLVIGFFAPPSGEGGDYVIFGVMARWGLCTSTMLIVVSDLSRKMLIFTPMGVKKGTKEWIEEHIKEGAKEGIKEGV